MVSEKEKVRHSSQVILRDGNGVLYLEKNAHLGKVSFWGGEKEDGDNDEFETALRELREELGIVFEKEELKFVERDSPKRFPKGIFVSTFFLIDINPNIVAEIVKNSQTVFFTLQEIRDSNESFVLGKEKFLKRIEKIFYNSF